MTGLLPPQGWVDAARQSQPGITDAEITKLYDDQEREVERLNRLVAERRVITSEQKRPKNEQQQRQTTVAPGLQFSTFADMAARVDAAGPRQWLVRGVWPHGAYGLHAAEPKAQKTWNALDLAVAVASGTPWLGSIPVDTTGPVIVFAGEGGEGSIVRRIRAVAEAHNVDANSLALHLCTRAPYLSDDNHLALMAAEIDRVRPVLVILDPLYLAARGGDTASLVSMGGLLERPQRVCEQFGTSLLVVHHFNKQRANGNGADRMSGVGPAEWGRVLISAAVKSRRTDYPDTRASDVVIELQVQGGEIPDRTLRLSRRIWADDPDDLDSPLHLTQSAGENDDVLDDPNGPTAGLPPAAQKIIEALRGSERPLRNGQIVDAIADRHGHGLRRETVTKTLKDLQDRALVEVEQDGDGPFAERWWRLAGREASP